MPIEGVLRVMGAPDGPVYHPSEEEFLNPLQYIATIRPEAEKYGICKIVPPPSWKPPFMVDIDTFEFNTRIQIVNELQIKVSSSPEYKVWNSKYLSFLKAQGKAKKRNPTFCGREIDLFKFHQLVEKKGGYDAACEHKGWREVARLLGVRLHRCCTSWQQTS
jgi:[histone H3]-trimethyl-L-lysine4 demethylase